MGMTGEQAYVLAKKLIEAGGGGGGTVDAYTRTQTDNLLIKKVDKEVGKGLFSGSYNDLSDAPTIPSKTSELQNDSGYLTEHQDLTDYAKKTDIPTVPSKVSEFENDKGYLTEHQDLTDYAKKTDIPSLNGYATEQWVGEQGYLTEHQDLSGYATNTQLSAVSENVTENSNNISVINNSLMYNNAGSHNSVYRGKNLGSVLTDKQKEQINAGTFEDMYIGDYWRINDMVWRIAAFNYWYRSGDTDLKTNHVVIIPEIILYTHVMNDTDDTTGGYVRSKMYTEGLEQAKTIIKEAFGENNILTHREYLINATSDGYASEGAWYDSQVELMNENMVYGSAVFRAQNSLGDTIPNSQTIDKSILPLFQFRPDLISNRQWYWLRDVVNARLFASVGANGHAYYGAASGSYGVRPVFGIKGA